MSSFFRLLRSSIEISHMNQQYLKTLTVDEVLLISTKTFSQLGAFLVIKLFVWLGSHQSHKCQYPKRKLLILDLQREQLQKIALEYIIVGQDKSCPRVEGRVPPDKFYQILNRLFTMGAPDVCLQDFFLILDGSDATKALDTEDYFVFKLSIFFLLIVID